MGTFALDLSLDLFCLGCFAGAPSFRLFRLGIFAWDLSLGNLRLGSSALTFSIGNFRSGSFAWELSPDFFFGPTALKLDPSQIPAACISHDACATADPAVSGGMQRAHPPYNQDRACFQKTLHTLCASYIACWRYWGKRPRHAWGGELS